MSWDDFARGLSFLPLLEEGKLRLLLLAKEELGPLRMSAVGMTSGPGVVDQGEKDLSIVALVIKLRRGGLSVVFYMVGRHIERTRKCFCWES